MSCGCCSCLSGAGTVPIPSNRPGLSSIRYRVGTHASFLEAMIRRLTVPHVAPGASGYSLHALTTRETDDPAIALLDGWATVADVLTFYQERIANEAYLRTATERRSILELGRLVGYRLKPGVSSSVYLAYTVDEKAKTIIPAGSKAQSIPGADEKPEMFETSEAIEARGAWNALRPRLAKPHEITLANVLQHDAIWIAGTNTRLEVGDPLLFVFAESTRPIYALRRVSGTTLEAAHDRTKVSLQPVRRYFQEAYAALRASTQQAPQHFDLMRRILLGETYAEVVADAGQFDDESELFGKLSAADADWPAAKAADDPTISEFLAPLAKARGLAPANRWAVEHSLATSMGERSDFFPRLLSSFLPQLGSNLYAALANATSNVTRSELLSVHVLRRKAAPFGYNAPPILFEDRPSDDAHLPKITYAAERDDVLFLDTPSEATGVGSFVVARTPMTTDVFVVRNARNVPRTAYGITGKTSRLELDHAWADFHEPNETEKFSAADATLANLQILRNTSVLAESEQLTLAYAPIDAAVGLDTTRIELDTLVEGLAPGRWIIITGERADLTGTAGIVASELAMIAGVEQQVDPSKGASPFSVLLLAPEGLAYRYKRATVKIFGNVVKATHGDTRNEIVGAGDASQANQTFTLRHTPLTFTSAPTQDGVASTLAIRVNDVLWHETTDPVGAGPNDRIFMTKIADDGKVSVIFGNGREGARLPTGNDNVRASYRSGIGEGGNVKPAQIATAISRPLGVKEVTNPIAASGGADPESRDDARRNIPVSLQAMGRVVSVRDYADFARTFAGISKASAALLSDGRRRTVHLTIGGSGDMEIEPTSDLLANLTEALRKFGDPYQPFVVAMREKLLVAGAARVRVHPDYLWTNVAPAIRSSLLDRFGYDRRELGQPLYPSEVVAAIQSVPGVDYVDLDALGGVKATQLVRFDDFQVPEGGLKPPRITSVAPLLPKLARRKSGVLRAAQIAYFPPELADLFILTEITNG